MKRRGHGEGSIHQRKSDGLWVATVNLGWRDGRRDRRTFYAKTRREAAERLQKALRDMGEGLQPTSDRLTVADYLHQWRASIRGTVRPATWRRYDQIIRTHLEPQLGNVPLTKLSAGHVERMMRHMLSRGAAPRSALHARAVLRTALTRAMRHGLVARNAAALADPPRVEHREAASLSPEQVRVFLDAIRGDRDEALYVCAIALGLRQGELLGLRWSDVDLAAGTVTVRHALQRVDGNLQLVETKTARSRRTIPLPIVAAEALRQHQETVSRDGRFLAMYVFTSSTGTPLDGPNVTKRYQKRLGAAGLPRMTFHALRHTTASLLLAQGAHPRVVMELLGHSQISLTMNTYSHVIPALQRDAADRMDVLLSG
jgi:integrase